MPKQYIIRIQGHLDREWQDVLHGMTLRYSNRNMPTTTLRGELDQTALISVLGRLHDLNVPILLVKRAPDLSKPPTNSP